MRGRDCVVSIETDDVWAEIGRFITDEVERGAANNRTKAAKIGKARLRREIRVALGLVRH